MRVCVSVHTHMCANGSQMVPALLNSICPSPTILELQSRPLCPPGLTLPAANWLPYTHLHFPTNPSLPNCQ
jgi:hypothetical protein